MLRRRGWRLTAVLFVSVVTVFAFAPKASADDWRIGGYYGGHGGGVSFSYGDGRHYRGHRGHQGYYRQSYAPRHHYYRSYGNAYYYPRVQPYYYGYYAPTYYYPAPQYYYYSGPSAYFYYSY